ncbi:helix-turn-helix domain-containing protein [Colwellia psychrerythraea]|nr:XRE family transcriptional regulator [Colwellia psychrerythraea]
MSMTVASSKHDARAIGSVSIGAQLKSIRVKSDLTLREAANLTTLAPSTLSKIENEQISPTFAVMQKLAAGLNIELPQLFTKPTVTQATGRRDVTLKEQGNYQLTSTYEHELLSTQFSHKKMMPYKCRVHARSFDEFGEWVRHSGEEYMLVLEGEVQLMTEFYEPVNLVEGDSVYYDAMMGHVLISVSENDAQILWVTAK